MAPSILFSLMSNPNSLETIQKALDHCCELGNLTGLDTHIVTEVKRYWMYVVADLGAINFDLLSDKTLKYSRLRFLIPCGHTQMYCMRAKLRIMEDSCYGILFHLRIRFNKGYSVSALICTSAVISC